MTPRDALSVAPIVSCSPKQALHMEHTGPTIPTRDYSKGIASTFECDVFMNHSFGHGSIINDHEHTA